MKRAGTCRNYVKSRFQWLSWMRVRLVIRRLRVRSPPVRQYHFVEIDHEISTTVILSLPLIQDGQSSFSGNRMCTILVNRLEDLAFGAEWEWRGRGNLGVIVIRVCESLFRNLPDSYIWPLKKTDLFIYLIVRNVDIFIYWPSIFFTYLLRIGRQIARSIHWIPREQAASKNLWSKLSSFA